MIIDWIKQHTLAAIVSAGLGIGVITVATVLVVGGDQSLAGPAKDAPFPPRFTVTSDAGHRFTCDLTITQDASCMSHGYLVMTLIRITIRRHAGDPTRVVVYGYQTEKPGVTWEQLRKGIVLGPTPNSRNGTSGPVTVVAHEPIAGR